METSQGYKTEKHRNAHIVAGPRDNTAIFADPNYVPAIVIDPNSGRDRRTNRAMHPKFEVYLTLMDRMRADTGQAPNPDHCKPPKNKRSGKLLRPTKILLRKLKESEIDKTKLNGKGKPRKWKRVPLSEYDPTRPEEFQYQTIQPAP